jgi:hypothetical protein
MESDASFERGEETHSGQWQKRVRRVCDSGAAMYIDFMNSSTQRFHTENSADLAKSHDACPGGISDHFSIAFPSESRILDVGCGSAERLNED